jgi:hypothetical protein
MTAFGRGVRTTQCRKVAETRTRRLRGRVGNQEKRTGKDKILGTMHTYPTPAEAREYVASEWKRARAPRGCGPGWSASMRS